MKTRFLVLAFIVAGSAHIALGAVPAGRFVNVRPVPGLQSPWQDVNPALTSDQLTIYFTSYRPEPPSFPANSAARDIWTATRDSKDEPFGEPTRLDAPINLEDVGDYSPLIADNGLTLYFQSSRETGLPGATYPWVSRRDSTAESWGEPELFVGDFNSFDEGLDVDVSTIDISEDSLELYFQTGRDGTYDIYQAQRETVEDAFGFAESVVGVNTERHGEWMPKISSDKLTLFYGHRPNDITEPPWPSISIATRSNVNEPFGDAVDINDFGLGSNINRGGAVDAWLSEAATANRLASPYFPGDANLDGAVDSQDLNAVGLSWNQPTTTWSGGDFNADGFVDSLTGNNYEYRIDWIEERFAFHNGRRWYRAPERISFLRRPRSIAKISDHRQRAVV